MVEFASADEARVGREKLLASGVLDRFQDKTDPKVLEDAEQVNYRARVGSRCVCLRGSGFHDAGLGY